MKKLLTAVLMSLFLVSCAGYDMPDILIEDKETGVKIETTRDGKVCLDDGKTRSGCVKFNKKEEVK